MGNDTHTITEEKMKKEAVAQSSTIDSKTFLSYMRSSHKFFSIMLDSVKSQKAVEKAREKAREKAEKDAVAEAIWAAMNTNCVTVPKSVKTKKPVKITAQGGLKCRESAVQAAVDAPTPGKQRYTHGITDLATGTKLHTTVRMKGRAAGEKRVIKAVVKDGKIYLVGRPRGYASLSRALTAARGAAGKADREYSTTPPTSAWYITDAGCSISHYRRNIA